MLLDKSNDQFSGSDDQPHNADGGIFTKKNQSSDTKSQVIAKIKQPVLLSFIISSPLKEITRFSSRLGVSHCLLVIRREVYEPDDAHRE